MVLKFPCRICQKPVGMKHKAIFCDLCNTWINIVCNTLDKKTYNIYKNQRQTCIAWSIKQTTDHELKHIYSGKHIRPFNFKDIEIFTTQINNRINENSEKWMNLTILKLQEHNFH